MLVDGKTIAKEILNEVAHQVALLPVAPRLAVITCAPNFETQKYLEMKRQKASSVGVVLNVVELPSNAETNDVIDSVQSLCREADGIIVQLPLPKQIDREKVLDAIPVGKDPDGFKYSNNEEACLSPVVGAIDLISQKHSIDWLDKKVVVLGQGVLVGLPATTYAKKKGGDVIVMVEEDFDRSMLRTADIIISGVGKPQLISKEDVKEGVIIFDGGTSEDGGILVGDVDTNVASIASLFTPVPGGIGPITIAYLFRNLVQLVRQ